MTSMRAPQADEISKPMQPREIAIPCIDTDDVLVRVVASSICRIKRRAWTGDYT